MENDSTLTVEEAQTFVEGLDFYFEENLVVLTRRYLLSRGFCCESGCRYCPYRPDPEIS